MHHSRKRKHRSEYSRKDDNREDSAPALDPALFIVAHEADIVRGPQATTAALSLEAVPKKGSALVRWGGQAPFGFDGQRQPAFPGDEDDNDREPQVQQQDEIWVDRYDARLLLDALPPVQAGTAPPARASSPGGWSDLPSDSEDTFFFSTDELEDYRRQKRRRTLDQAHEDRLRARLAEDEEENGNEGEDMWGGSDEEPDDTQKELMRRTAAHLHSSPNSAQLEMRILANHGADPRFAFLRGRWSRTWKLVKLKVRMQAEEAKAPSKGTLGALASYGDSDEEGSDS